MRYKSFEALRVVHAPPNSTDVAALLARSHPAQQRLAFDELLAHQIGMRKLRRHLRAMPAPAIKHDKRRRRAFLDALPFALTKAQGRVLGDIDRDLAAGKPMLRLVQGDVGSGKTWSRRWRRWLPLMRMCRLQSWRRPNCWPSSICAIF